MNELNDEVNELKIKIEDTNSNVMKLLNAMIGSELTRDGGLVGKVARIESKVDTIDSRVNALEKKEDKRAVQYATLIGIGSLIGSAILWAIQIAVQILKK
jgi:tetrahydromethanopterin S-methyltransferase subunit G